MKKVYKIEVDCANCAAKMEQAIKKTEGIVDASVSFMALRLTVEFCEGVDEDAVMKKALKACRRIERDCEIYFE